MTVSVVTNKTSSINKELCPNCGENRYITKGESICNRCLVKEMGARGLKLSFSSSESSKQKNPKNHFEDDNQEAFFQWVGYQHYKGKPLSDFVWATPNGGKRNELEAKRFKRQGVKPGVYDITVAIPLNGCHGMFIEMKWGNNTLTDDQLKFKLNMTAMGYLCVECYSWEEAVEELEAYLNSFGTPPAGIDKIGGKKPYRAYARKTSKNFTRRSCAVNWLAKRGFDENGERI